MTYNTIATTARLLREIADEMERNPNEGFKEFKWSMQQGPFRINEDGWVELCRRAADPGYAVCHWKDLRNRAEYPLQLREGEATYEEANAHLIAAAPDLLEALEMVLDDPNALDGRPRTADVVFEALAKAYGKTP